MNWKTQAIPALRFACEAVALALLLTSRLERCTATKLQALSARLGSSPRKPTNHPR